jgi:hypothetical protein
MPDIALLIAIGIPIAGALLIAAIIAVGMRPVYRYQDDNEGEGF